MFTKKNIIYAIYRSGGFSRAAESLHISQPSLSVMVSRLESELGEKLFDRSTNPVRLTYIGRKYIECCESINMIEEDFSNYINEYKGLEAGRFSLGGSNLFIDSLMPDILSQYFETHPGIDISLIEHGSLELKSMLIAGDLDIVIDNELYDEKKFTSYPVGSEYLLIAVPANDSLNKSLAEYAYTAGEIIANEHVSGARPYVRDLHVFDSHPFIQMQKEYDTRTRSDHVFGEQRITLHSLFELDQLSSTFFMAASGLGLAVVSDTIVKSSSGKADRMLFYAVDHPDFVRRVCYYTRRDKFVTRAMRELIDMSRSFSTLTITE